MEWINVKDRLPENGQLVWCYYLPNKQVEEDIVYKNGKWYDDIHDNSYLVNSKGVTHWMPKLIPEPPQCT